MKLIILDITSSNYKLLDSDLMISTCDIVLSLTPSATYYLETKKIQFITFHDLISTEDFRNKILTLYRETLLINESKYTKGFFRDIAQFINYFLFLETIVDFTKKCEYEKVHYYTDKISIDEVNSLSNLTSLLSKYIKFDKIVNLDRINNHGKRSSKYLQKYSLKKLYSKIINKILRKNLKYDWLEVSPKVTMQKIITEEMELSFELPSKIFKLIDIYTVNFKINESRSNTSNFKTFLEKHDYVVTVKLKEKSQNLFFFQHGSYLYKNIFIEYSEVELATINFVLNGYTESFFIELGAKKIYNVGSTSLNLCIKEKKKRYDFLYITHGHDYTGNLQYVDFPNSLHSFDGHELYQRHKSIIKLFGTKFKDKKIIIRVHPTVVTTGVYVPFWELAEDYPNITIDVSIPIHNLIEQSKYIISDYFTTEFINRELHYKRDIILFKGAPTPLPEETIEDMKKMFILVDTINDLKEKIENIEKITKNRKRYDDIIEYYSSKKCDTKKVVTEILEKELK